MFQIPNSLKIVSLKIENSLKIKNWKFFRLEKLGWLEIFAGFFVL